jgi:hypothetical protein
LKLPRRFHVWALAVGVVTAVASTWPMAAHLSDHVVDGARFVSPAAPTTWAASNIGADVITTVWILNWVLHALVTQPLHLFDANIFYPTPLAGARQEILFGADLLGIPGALLVGPVFAHQTALLLCLILTFWAAAYVVARWTGSLVGGLVAGILLTVSPFHQGQLYHLQSLGTMYLPLIVFGLERFGATGRPRWAALVGMALAMQIVTGQYLGCMAVVTAAAGGAVSVVAGRADDRPFRRMGRDALWLGGAAAAATLVTLPFAIPYFRLSATGDIPDHRHVLTHNVWHLGEYLPWSGWWASIAITAWLLALAGVVVLARGGRAGRVRAAMLVTIWCVGAFASLGAREDRLTLWGVLAAVVPGFAALREPIRFALLPYLAIALLGGCAAAAAARRFPRVGTAAVLVMAVAAAYEVWHGPIPLRYVPVGRDVPEVYRVLARCGDGDPLIELPIAMAVDNFRDADPQLASVYHFLPLLNGRASYSPALLEDVRRLANLELTVPAARDELRRLTGVRWVLVHCKVRVLSVVVALCHANGVWKTFPSRAFGSGDDEVRLYDLGRVATLPRPVPRRPEPTPGCITADR